MKSTMITRPVDANGRIVIPKHLLTEVLMAKEDEKIAVEIFYDDDAIILKRFHPSCAFCEARDNLISFNDALICPECLEKLKQM